MPRLTDTQLVILAATAERDTDRDDGAVLPLPASLKINKGAATTVLKSLVARGLIAERPAQHHEESWRDVNDRRMMLVITEAGLEAIGVEPDRRSEVPPTDRKTSSRPKSQHDKTKLGNRATASPHAIRPGTKLTLLIDLLKRKDGATIDELAKKTDWQNHSVRGAISGTLKMGLDVTTETIEGRGRVYRIADAKGDA